MCHKEFNEYDSFRIHSAKVHHIRSEDLFIEYKLKNVRPMCKCGCGGFTKFYCSKTVGMTFREYIAGHQSRIHNNWGHNKKAIDASTETRRHQYSSGERTVWNDGLDESDIRVKNNITNLKLKCKDPDERRNRSVRMSKLRKDGTIPTLFKEKSSQWKGGISSIQSMARSCKRLYDEWKYPILINSKFKCCQCDRVDQFHIHHDKETFSEIIKKVMTLEDYEFIDDFDRKKLICDKIVDYHVQNKISGKCLCSDCHKKYHPSLNFN